MFYFSYQLKLELLPHILAEIRQFGTQCREIDPQDPQHVSKAVSLALKRRRDLDAFYSRCYEDFRAPLIQECLQLIRVILCGLSQSRQPLLEEDVSQQMQQKADTEKPPSKPIQKQSQCKSSHILLQPVIKPSLSLAKSSTTLKVANRKTELPKTGMNQMKEVPKVPLMTKMSSVKSLKSKSQSTKQLEMSVVKPLAKEEYMQYLKNKQKMGK